MNTLDKLAAAILILAATLAAGATWERESTPPVVVTETVYVNTLPACVEEDSDNCFWDATTMGNGQGESFVTLNGVTYYAR